MQLKALYTERCVWKTSSRCNTPVLSDEIGSRRFRHSRQHVSSFGSPPGPPQDLHQLWSVQLRLRCPHFL